ncbi:MAG: sulfurtransferase TusA family protein [Candidatus Nanopelagicales bacterium]|jgi:tRNA 2-thiouridine synthesizing protein A
MDEVMDEEIALDQRGERCPMPIVALGRTAMNAASGAIIAVTCTDPGAQYDVPAWCAMKGAQFLGASNEDDGATTYRVRLP